MDPVGAGAVHDVDEQPRSKIDTSEIPPNFPSITANPPPSSLIASGKVPADPTLPKFLPLDTGSSFYQRYRETVTESTRSAIWYSLYLPKAADGDPGTWKQQGDHREALGPRGLLTKGVYKDGRE